MRSENVLVVCRKPCRLWRLF